MFIRIKVTFNRTNIGQVSSEPTSNCFLFLPYKKIDWLMDVSHCSIGFIDLPLPLFSQCFVVCGLRAWFVCYVLIVRIQSPTFDCVRNQFESAGETKKVSFDSLICRSDTRSKSFGIFCNFTGPRTDSEVEKVCS